MDFLPYKEPSDEDTQALIAYLRSLPAAKSAAATGDSFNFVGAVLMGSGMFSAIGRGCRIGQGAARRDHSRVRQVRGHLGECRGCHGPDMTGVEASALGAAVPNPRPIVGTWTKEQFAQAMRTGVRPSGAPFTEAMPWQNASKMTDDDLTALYAYLKANP